MKNLSFQKGLTIMIGILFTVLTSLTMSVTEASAQCTNNNVYYMDLTPPFVGGTSSSSCVFGGEYCTATVCQGANYTFSTCATSSFDTQITLFNGAGTTALAYDDDSCAPQSIITWTATFSGTVRIVVDEYNCLSNQVCANLSVTQNTACPSSCSNLSMSVSDAGCEDNGFGVLPTINTTYFFNGACSVDGLWLSENGGSYQFIDLFAFGLTSGESVQIIDLSENSSYSLYYELSNGSFSPLYTYNTGSCGNTGCSAATFVIDPDCYGSEVSWSIVNSMGQTEYSVPAGTYNDLTPLGGNAFTYSLCFDPGCYTFNINDTYGDGMLGAQYSNCDVDGDFYMYDEFGNFLVDGSPSYGFGSSYSFCIGSSNCLIYDVYGSDLGCDATYNWYQFQVDYDGGCTVETMMLWSEALGWETLDLTSFGYSSMDLIDIYFGQSNAYYEFYFILSDGTETGLYYVNSIDCDGSSCSPIGAGAQYVMCDGVDEQVGFYATYSGSCTPIYLWVYTSMFGWEFIDVSADQLASEELLQLGLTLDNTVYQYYFEMADGLTTPTYTYVTGQCPIIQGCSNLTIDYSNDGCFPTAEGDVPSGSIYFNYTGSCLVTTIYSSANGGAYEALDITAYGYGSGEFIQLLFNFPNAIYDVYYELSDGSISPVVSFTNDDCLSGETICDCDGNQLPIEATAWLGDGFYDDGTYTWDGVPVNFGCALWGFDCGDDTEAPGTPYDVYGVCSGSLPPANGCVVEDCYLTNLIVATDCYPQEINIYIFNENGDQVVMFGQESFILEQTQYTASLCLPAGCYTYMITDSYGDGLAGCDPFGFFGVQDQGTGVYLVFGEGDAYTTSHSEVFCVGPVQTCSNLNLDITNQPCQDYDGTLTPSVNFAFEFSGGCTVSGMYLAEVGGTFEFLDAAGYDWGSGDQGSLFNLTPDTDYIIYYVLDDGSTSGLFTFSTGNCNNEITICDCAGTEHSIGVLSWLGDGFADNGFYQWAGQDVDFNCSTWGYDCGDVPGAPDFDPYNVCGGGLPPNNGCGSNVVLGCTDPIALNYNPQATQNDGSCIYNISVGCTNPDACNYNPNAIVDNGTCEFITCAGCTDSDATNYDPTATIDDGSCFYNEIEGCTDEEALNYDPIATADDGSCVYQCVWPNISYDPTCVVGQTGTFMIEMSILNLGNGAPYTVTNSYNNDQYTVNFTGSINIGPFPNGVQVVVQVVSIALDGCFITSPILTEDCTNGITSGCTDMLAMNYNPQADEDDGSCQYDFTICDCGGDQFSPAVRFQLGNGIANNGAGGLPNFNCPNWGYDCGDIIGAPTDDPNGVCSGNIPPNNGCTDGVGDIAGGSFNVYPNPNNGTFIIVNNGNQEFITVRLYDSAGRKVMEQTMTITSAGSLIELQNVASGSYHLEIVSGEKAEHVNLIIQQ